MFNLAEYRRKPQALADFLPWAALIAPGIVLNKDGSLQRTARYRGPDLDSATPAELVGAASRLNNALRRLGSGWAVFVEASRNPALDYPHSTFPEPVSALVDIERRAQFEAAGSHFESAYYGTAGALGALRGAVRSGASMASDAASAYRASAAASGVTGAHAAAAGTAGVDRAGASAISERFSTMVGPRGTAASSPASTSAQTSAPEWAQRFRRHQRIAHGASVAAHSVRSGDHGGGGTSISLSEDRR